MSNYPGQKRLIRCAECKIETVYTCTKHGEWVCWCGHVDAEPVTVEKVKEEVMQ